MNVLAREEVFAVLREELQAMKKHAAAERMSEHAHFKNDMGLDSLDIVEFVARAELRYRVHVPDEDFPRLDSIGKVIDYVLAHSEATQGPDVVR